MESYTEFMEELREKVAEKLGEGYETEIHQIAKANAGVMDALTVFQSGGKAKVGPNFYLPPLFREHRAGREVEAVAGDIVAMYHAQAPSMEELADSLGDITQYENIKGRLYFRLLNTGKNRAFLKDVLHFMVLDLSMVVYILVREDGDRLGAGTEPPAGIMGSPCSGGERAGGKEYAVIVPAKSAAPCIRNGRYLKGCRGRRHGGTAGCRRKQAGGGRAGRPIHHDQHKRD